MTLGQLTIRRELRFGMQLGQASSFSQLSIESSLKLVGSNPPSGKDFNFAQFLISRISRDAGKLFAIDSIFGQMYTERCLRAIGNSFFDDKDVSSMHDRI